MKNIIKKLNDSKLEALMDMLRLKGFHIYTISGETITNKQTFFNEALKILPLDPPLSGVANLDAFSDSFWGGLIEAGHEKVALVWTNVDNIIKNFPNDFERIIRCLEDLSENISSTDKCMDSRISVKVFLLGTSKDFYSDDILSEI